MRSQSLVVGVVSVVWVLPVDERSLVGVMRCTCGMEVVVVAVVVVAVLDNGRMDLAKRRSMAETVVEKVQLHSCSVQVVWELYLPCTGSVIIYDDS